MRDIQQLAVFVGSCGKMSLSNILPHLTARKYQFVGQMVQWSVRHGGPGLPVFSPAFYRLLTDGSISADDVQYIADVDVRQRVQQVCVVTSYVFIIIGCPQYNYFMSTSAVQQQQLTATAY